MREMGRGRAYSGRWILARVKTLAQPRGLQSLEQGRSSLVNVQDAPRKGSKNGDVDGCESAQLGDEMLKRVPDVSVFVGVFAVCQTDDT